MDETPCKVMHIDDTKSGKKTYMWVYRNRPLRGTPPIVLFDWEPRRAHDYPREFLKGFSGTIVTDGYQVYHRIANKRDDLKVAGCWIHSRRKYAEQAIRPFTIEKKNFLFCKSVNGAKARALLFTA